MDGVRFPFDLNKLKTSVLLLGLFKVRGKRTQTNSYLKPSNLLVENDVDLIA